jgi:F420-non-reducing hydrogenase small subunit
MGFFDFLKKKKKEDKCECGCEKKDAKAKAKAAPAAKAEAPKAAAPKAAAAPAKTGNYVADSPIAGFIPDLKAPAGGKINLAIYWAAACGGCDVSLLDTDEKVLNIGTMANIVMWPIAADGKEKDIAAMKDGDITVSIINGAVRNSENESMVKLLRQKSKLVISYGTCACFGGTPALANLVNNASEVLDYVYTKTPTSKDFQQTYHKDKPVIPQTSYKAPEGELTLPVVYDIVKSLDQVIDVDYYIPGCPPTQESITQLLNALVAFVYNGQALPPKGTMIGVTNKSLCEECGRHKENKRMDKIMEPYQVNVDPNACLMDQGILCLGPATVGGCGAKCTHVGQPCRGCYGPTKAVSEQGASIFTAVASLFPISLDDDATCGEDKIADIMSTIKDPLGYFYAFTMSKAQIRAKVTENKKGGQ